MHENVNTYIFDSHRPFNHWNIHTKKSIFVIDDGEIPSLDLIPDDDDLALLDEEAEEAEEANDEENENQHPNSEDQGELSQDSNAKWKWESDGIRDVTWKQEWREIADQYY